MTQHDDGVFLLHMLDAARAVRRFMVDRSRDDLHGDELLLAGVIQKLEVIGEAANRVGEEGRRSMPDLPWRQVVDMRNRLIHGYFAVDPDIVWATVTTNVPELIRLLVRGGVGSSSDE